MHRTPELSNERTHTRAVQLRRIEGDRNGERRGRGLYVPVGILQADEEAADEERRDPADSGG